ncbi:YdcF family protein [Pontibacter silvestris]|nr:YdcF family protein [Pontibacter silvestris]
MFYILSKTLHFLLMPLLWVLVLLLLALFLKSPEKKRGCLVSAVALLLVLSNPFLANEAWRAWEVEATPVSDVDNYDAAIILSGVTSFREDIPDRVHTYKGADRFLHPLQLYRMDKVQKLIISGGHGLVLGEGIPESEQIEKVLLMAGVPEEDVITEVNSRNTHENAVNTKELLMQHPELKKLLLVTSAFHMRRAAGCFEKAGVATDHFSTDFYSYERRFTPDETIIPSADALHSWQRLIHEISGYIIYKILGYC